MQIKKEYTREQIIIVAKRIFLKKGFSKTSMRDIAKGAGIGVSNLYNYFVSKDELFRHIVMPLMMELEKMMLEHHDLRDQEQFRRYASGESDELLIEHVQSYMRLISNYRDELKLILYQAQGSSLETFIDEYTERCTQQVLQFMNVFKSRYPNYCAIHTTFTYHIHLVWMFNFISEVIKHQLDPQELKNAIEDYIQFEFVGWRAVMNKHSKI